jgi:hypothetical protein
MHVKLFVIAIEALLAGVGDGGLVKKGVAVFTADNGRDIVINGECFVGNGIGQTHINDPG